ncbi:MAG: ABC-ATPase domain-containing protein, partial [Nitrospinaceae bacterium]
MSESGRLDASIPEALRRRFLELDGQNYKAYKTLQNTHWAFGPFQLTFEHVQGDPFATPSR